MQKCQTFAISSLLNVNICCFYDSKWRVFAVWTVGGEKKQLQAPRKSSEYFSPIYQLTDQLINHENNRQIDI